MNNFDGVVLEAVLSVTDRGSLWLATRTEPGDRIIRKIDPRYCDAQFLKTLASLRANPGPRIVPIVNEGWIEDDYCLEYAPPGAWQLLKDYLSPIHWRQRLYIIYQICEALQDWEHGPVRPLGPHPNSIVMIEQSGAVAPWLLACPPLPCASPLEFWECEPDVLAFLPPEVVRGVYTDHRLQDGFSVAAMTAVSLGCPLPAAGQTREDLLDAHVRGRLVPVADLEKSEVEGFLRIYPPITRLADSIRLYTLASPFARQANLQQLKTMVAAALNETEATVLARSQLEVDSDTDKVFEMLEWGFRTGSDSVQARSFASELAMLIGDLDLAITHADQAVALSPGSLELRRKRCDLRMVHLLSSPITTADAKDAEGDLLLADLEWLLGATFEPANQRELVVKTAQVYLHRQDFSQAANLLYLAVEQEPSDLNALHLYARCLRQMGADEAAAQVVVIAHDRIDKMANNQMLAERTAREWREKFKNI